MNALRDRQFWQDIGRNAQDAARGAVRGIGTALPGAAVDLVNMAYLPAANALGYGIDPSQVVGSSAWFASQGDQAGLLPQGDSPSFRGGEFFGPMLAAAAPDSVNMLASGAGKVGNFLADAVGDLSRTPMRNQLGAIAYHGSPHKFDQFDMSKIGTGEGAQAYGHGLYFSEAPSVAKSYQGSVSAMHSAAGKATGGNPTIGGSAINWDDPAHVAAFEISRHNGDRAAAADFHARTFLGGENNPAVKLLRSDAELPSVDLPGALYTVDIPDEAIGKMLDWDAPLSGDTAEAVKKALQDYHDIYGDKADVRNAYKDAMGALKSGNMTGEGAYKSLVRVTGDAQTAANVLKREYGVPGIKYLDAGSRGTGTGTRNFVLFDDKLPKIKSRE